MHACNRHNWPYCFSRNFGQQIAVNSTDSERYSAKVIIGMNENYRDRTARHLFPHSCTPPTPSSPHSSRFPPLRALPTPAAPPTPSFPHSCRSPLATHTRSNRRIVNIRLFSVRSTSSNFAAIHVDDTTPRFDFRFCQLSSPNNRRITLPSRRYNRAQRRSAKRSWFSTAFPARSRIIGRNFIYSARRGITLRGSEGANSRRISARRVSYHYIRVTPMIHRATPGFPNLSLFRGWARSFLVYSGNERIGRDCDWSNSKTNRSRGNKLAQRLTEAVFNPLMTS